MTTIKTKAVLARLHIALEQYTEQGSRPFLDSNNRYINVPVILQKEPHIEAEVVFIAANHALGCQSHTWKKQDDCWHSLTGDEEITNNAASAALSAITETLIRPEEQGINLNCRVQRLDGTLFWINPQLNKITVWIDTSTDPEFSHATTIVVSFLNPQEMDRLQIEGEEREEIARRNMILPLSVLLENRKFQEALYIIYKNIFEQLIFEQAMGFEEADIQSLTSSFASTYQEIMLSTKREKMKRSEASG